MKKQAVVILCFLCSTILFLRCTSKEQPNEIKIIKIKEFKLSDQTQDYLHRMYTVVMDNPYAQELAFSNVNSPVGIVLTDYNGEFIEQLGDKGRGPDEILSARYFGFDNNQNLVILDKASAFFKLFNRTNDTVTSYKYSITDGLSIVSRNFQQCQDNWYLAIQLIGKPTYTDVPTIGIFDSTFNMIESFGGYDPFFQGRRGILQETLISVDCEAGLIFTTHAKTPFIQVFSIDKQKLIGRSTNISPSFMLSDKFITMVTNPREMARFMTEEQSTSLFLAYSDKYVFHIFRNDRYTETKNRNLNDRDHFVAVYDKKSLAYIGETKLHGAVLGSTKDGSLILLNDESTFEIQLIKIQPVLDPIGD